MSWTEDTHKVLRSRDKHILVLLLTQTEVYVCVSANEHFGKNEPRKYTHGPYTKVLTPVWSETLCVSPHLSVQACHHHPCYCTQSLTPLSQPSREASVRSAAKGRLGLLLFHYPAHSSLLLGLDTSSCFTFTSSLSWGNSSAWKKKRQQDLLVILRCYQQPDALYTVADLAWCLNWSQHTWLSSPSYQIESTALK